MKFVPVKVSRAVGLQILKTKKNSPQLLFGAGVIGMVGTVVLASRATLKLEETLAETEVERKQIALNIDHNADYSEKDAQHDRAVVLGRSVIRLTRLYAPAVGLGVVSIACLTGSHNILSKRNAGLTAAYAALSEGFDEYRKRVANEVGDEREREIYYSTEEREIVEEGDKGPEVKQIQQVSDNTKSPYGRFFDETNKNWNRRPMENQVFINVQQNYANEHLRGHGFLFLNDVYEMLGFEKTKAGQIVGWVWDEAYATGDRYVDFGIFSDPFKGRQFVNGEERSIFLDFNVDGPILDLLDKINQG